jgi:hypothetical protein
MSESAELGRTIEDYVEQLQRYKITATLPRSVQFFGIFSLWTERESEVVHTESATESAELDNRIIVTYRPTE